VYTVALNGEEKIIMKSVQGVDSSVGIHKRRNLEYAIEEAIN
jgi:hypothetical protein